MHMLNILTVSQSVYSKQQDTILTFKNSDQQIFAELIKLIYHQTAAFRMDFLPLFMSLHNNYVTSFLFSFNLTLFLFLKHPHLLLFSPVDKKVMRFWSHI